MNHLILVAATIIPLGCAIVVDFFLYLFAIRWGLVILYLIQLESIEGSEWMCYYVFVIGFGFDVYVGIDTMETILMKDIWLYAMVLWHGILYYVIKLKNGENKNELLQV